LVKTLIAVATLAVASPVFAQDARGAGTEAAAQEKLDKFAGMMAGLLQTEPLTAEQQARLPAAQDVVGTMMPDGFYGKMVNDMMDKMMRPMMSMFTAPEFILGSRLEVEQEAIEALAEAEQVEIMTMLDPAYDRRVDAILEVLTGKMGGMFSAMEGPMRDGLAKAYAVRFDDTQLADISAFFATPTGGEYARESMALFADPQVVQASMQALPAMMSGLGDMETAMAEAMASLPAERDYADLTPAERARLAALLGVDAENLGDIVKPPRPTDGTGDDPAM
jgi:hypothetical protein